MPRTVATATPKRSCLTDFAIQPDPLKILIVTSKLLTGFDAPILQAMYLDKPLRGPYAATGDLPHESALR